MTLTLNTSRDYVQLGYNKEKLSDQLTQQYFLPKYQQLMFDNAAWHTTFLCQCQDKTITVSFRPHYDLSNLNKKLTMNIVYISENDKKSQILELICDGIIVHGTYLDENNLLGLIIQRQQNNTELVFDAAVFFCGYQSKITYQYTGNVSRIQKQYYPIYQNQATPMQIHFVHNSFSFQLEKPKVIKHNKVDLYTKQKMSQRLLIFMANKGVYEYQLDFDYYKLQANKFGQDETKEFLQQCPVKYNVQLKQLVDFVYFSACNEIYIYQQHHSEDDINSIALKPSFMSYDNCSQDLIIVYRAHKKKSFYLRLYLYKWVSFYNQQNENSFKQIQQFNTALLPQLQMVKILPLDNLILRPNTCRISYQVYGALNNALNIEILQQNEEKVHLITFHLPTGSVLKLTCQTSLSQINVHNVENNITNNQISSHQIIRFIKSVVGENNINDDDEQYNMYKFLCYERNIFLSQPMLMAYKYCQLWLVPNILTERVTVHVIKIMPFIPLEQVFTEVIPLFSINYHRRFTDFVNGDNEFFEDCINRKPYDIEMFGRPDQELCFKMSKDQIKRNLDMSVTEQQIYDFANLASSDTIPTNAENSVDSTGVISEDIIDESTFQTQFENTTDDDVFQLRHENTMQAITEAPLIMQSPSVRSNDISSIQITTNTSTLELNVSQIIQSPDNRLFRCSVLTPVFTQNNIAAYYCQNHMYSQHCIYNQRNMFTHKARFIRISQEHDNIFEQLAFYQQMNHALKQYDANQELHKLYDITQFTIIMNLFISQYYDRCNNQINQLVINPGSIIKTFCQNKSSDNQQHSFAKFLNFLCDMCQQCAQLYQMQISEFMNICKTIVGKDFFNIISQFNVTQQLNQLTNIQKMVDYFLNLLIHNNIEGQTQFVLQSDLLYAIIRFSQMVLRLLQNCDKVSMNISPQAFEYYMADYILNTYINNLLSGKQRKQQIVRMTSIVVFADFQDKKLYHPLAKQYVYNQYLQQTILKQFLEDDELFLKVIQQSSVQAINKLNNNYKELVYYKLFDNQLKSIQDYVLQLLNPKLAKNKHFQQEVTNCTSGGQILYNIGFMLKQLYASVSKSVSEKHRYALILNDTAFFQNKYLAITEIYEALNIRIYNQLLMSGTQFNSKRGPELPMWLKQEILKQFDKSGLADQAPFFYMDVNNDLSEVSDIVNQHTELLYNKSQHCSCAEYQLFEDSYLPYQFNQDKTKKQINLIDEYITKITKNEVKLQNLRKTTSISSYIETSENGQKIPSIIRTNFTFFKNNKLNYTILAIPANQQFLLPMGRYETIMRQMQIFRLQIPQYILYQNVQNPVNIRIPRQVQETHGGNHETYIPSICGNVINRLDQLLQDSSGHTITKLTQQQRVSIYKLMQSTDICDHLRCLDCVSIYIQHLASKRNFKFYGMVHLEGNEQPQLEDIIRLLVLDDFNK